MRKRLICFLLSFAMLLTLVPVTALAAEGDLPDTMFIPASDALGLPARILLNKPSSGSPWGGGIWGGGWGGWGGGGSSSSSTKYQLYLPGCIDAAQCFFSWEGGLSCSDGTETYESGSAPIPAPGQTVTYTFTKGSSSKAFTVTTWQGTESVRPTFIEIDESLGTISAMNNDSDHETSCSGLIYIDGEQHTLSSIKGRGNSSWMMANKKKPYNVTLGEKVNILGLDGGKTKKYSFLANSNETSIIRNKLGYDMAHKMGVGLDSVFSDVWMNGTYLGTYLITPKTDSFITDDGFMVENDNYKEDPVEQGGDPSFDLEGLIGQGSSMNYYNYNRITVKKIGDNFLGEEETVESLKAAGERIRVYMQEVWDAIRSEDGYNAQGNYYADYVDMPSWAAMYLMQEYVKNYDFCGGSLFFYREGTEPTDKLYAGPIWDLDIAFGCTSNSPTLGNSLDLLSSNGWFIRNISETKTSMYKYIGHHEDFMEEVARQYSIYHKVFEEAPAYARELAESIRASALMNDEVTSGESATATSVSRETRKNTGTEYAQVYKVTNTWEDYVDNVITYCEGRSLFFSNNFTVTEPEGYKADFACAKECSVTVYDTQDASVEGTKNASIAYARNSESGEIDLTGDGQINFRVITPEDARIANVIVAPSENYKNLKEIEPGLYRVTKVTGDITITIVTESNVCRHEFADGECIHCGEKAHRIDFDCDEHCSVTVYDTQVLENGTEKAAFAYAKSSETGEIDISGDGQVSFVVVPDPGYEVASVTAEPANFKNLKTPADTMSPNYYRITKITGDTTVSVTVEKIVCEHTYVPVVTAPTCTEKGFTTYTCSKCGSSYVDNETKALGHSLKETRMEATCTLAGSVTKTCSRCDYQEITEIPALGHDLKETHVEATCTLAGSVTKACSRCDYQEVTEIPALGHDYVNGVCTRCNEKAPDVVCDGGESCPSKAFADSPKAGTWSHAGIDYCIENGLMNGISDTLFHPNGTLTRGQLVTILYRIAGKPASSTEISFTDTVPGRYYADAVRWAAENGIVNGYNDGTFRPDAEISREQIATILYRYAGSPAVDGTLDYPDCNQAGNYAKDALLWATQNEFLTGIKTADTTLLSPKSNATRAQIATIIMRYLKAK